MPTGGRLNGGMHCSFFSCFATFRIIVWGWDEDVDMIIAPLITACDCNSIISFLFVLSALELLLATHTLIKARPMADRAQYGLIREPAPARLPLQDLQHAEPRPIPAAAIAQSTQQDRPPHQSFIPTSYHYREVGARVPYEPTPLTHPITRLTPYGRVSRGMIEQWSV